MNTSTRTEKNKVIQNKLEEEEKRNKRKKMVKLFIKVTFIILIFFFGIYFYTNYTSTKGLITKEERIKNKKIPDSFSGSKIIQFSDLYYGSTITKNEVKRLVKTINIRKPDLIVFTGNLIDPEYKISTKEQEELIKELQKLDSTIGKYAVSGKYDDDKYSTILTQSDFNILNNDYDLVYMNDNNPIMIVGLSSLLQKKRDSDKAYRYYKEETHNYDIYTITITSETDDVDNILSEYNSDLILAGNSMNGQIRLPFIGGIIKKEGSKKYKDPYYKINNTKLYVSSGIGAPDAGFRFMARPSINFFRLTKIDS